MKKIIHVLAGKANPNTLNGVNKVVHSIAEEQIKANNDVTVCGVANNIIERHHHNYDLELIKKNTVYIFPPNKLLSFIFKQGRDTIIHLHSAFVSWFPILVIILRLSGYQYVITPHGAYAPNSFKNDKTKVFYFYFIESIILLLARKVHLIGGTEINKITKLFLNKKHVLIPNGCNPVTNIIKGQNKEFAFGYMGRLQIDHKGLDLFLAGFSEYIKQGGKGVALLVGDGPDCSELKKISEQFGILDKVSFLGVKFGKEKEEFLKNISFFIHTSRWDVFPTGCLEAAAYGVPLLISKETNMGDVVSKYNAGYVLDSKTPKEIKKALFFLENAFYTGGYDSLQNNVIKMVQNELSWFAINDTIQNKIYKF